MSKKVYDPIAIEEKWQQYWEENKYFLQTENQEIKDTQDKMYLLFAFAYPSGTGLHVGHVESKTALDILARYSRMNGKQVFFPVGWDGFGLPAENYAIKTGVPPVETTKNAINTFRRQIKRLGISYDWENELATCHPGYYRWTQWLFLELYRAGLAYQDTGMVNWCPSCQTVLANEQVVDGACERCDSQVEQKEMEQWFFKITDYKDELIEGLNQVDWPAPTKQQQINWIGKKEGAEISFKIKQNQLALPCFTTRPDTIFGVTFVVISPEKFRDLELNQLVDSGQRDEVEKYLDQAFKKTEEERQIGEKDKTGVNTGLLAVNPVNQQEVPIFVADYVLGGYGTGAVMGVPAHDERDFAFAKKHQQEIKPVITWDKKAYDQQSWQAFYAEPGQMVNSEEFDGLVSAEALSALVDKFPQEIVQKTNYKLRDWLISRQRYWGAPIPIVYDPEGNPHPVKEEHLPWELPTDVDFKPTGESPLRSSQEFKDRTERLYGKGWTPEYDTMDTFVDSSWYYLRYVSSREKSVFSTSAQLQKWLPVDFYMIGPEHIVLHLLYSRFFTKFLRDQGYLKFDEPFMKMRHQGMILGPDGKKMSKSKGNVINPDDVVEKFGADTLRMYEMFMGPIEADKPWDVSAVAGTYRFLNRVYQLVQTASAVSNDLEKTTSEELERKLHQVIKKVNHDIPALKFNTAIAIMMELINVWESLARKSGVPVMSQADALAFIKILAPFAPFMAEELYQGSAIKNRDSIHLESWPTWDEDKALEQEIPIVVQVNGKIRGEVVISPDQLDDKEQVLALAKAATSVQVYLKGKDLTKEIYVPGKIVSLVVR